MTPHAFADPDPRPAPQEAAGTGGLLVHGRSACLLALRDILLQALHDGVATLWCVDADFADWPLGEPAVVDALVQWARPAGRSLQMIGGHFEVTAHCHPRFAQWRREWSHRAETWSPTPAAHAAQLPALLVVPARAGIEIVDRVHWRARLLEQPAPLKQALERCDALRQHCEAAWPATTLGL